VARAEIQTALNALTKDQIDAVLTEWRQLGREEFLRTHKVNRAAKFKIRDENSDYDAKAILVVALRRFRAEYQEISSTEIESNELTIATPLRDLGYSVVEIDDDPLKINDEVVAAEVRSLLQIDNSRLGEVWRLNQKGISHREIATQLGAKTSNFVNKILRFVRAIEIGNLPTARTMVEECHDKLKAFIKAHDAQMSESTRLVLSERLSELLNRKEGKRTLDEMIQEVLDLNKSYVQDNDAPPMRRRFNLMKNELVPAIQEIVKDNELSADWKVKGTSFSSGAVLGSPYLFTSSNVHAPQAPKEGLYLVILFAKDGSAAYLSLNQGVTGDKNAPIAENVAACRAKIVDRLGSATFDAIHMADPVGVGKRYEPSNIASIKYSDKAVPSAEQIFEDVEFMLELQQFLYTSKGGGLVMTDSLAGAVAEFDNAIDEAGLIFSGINESLPSSFLRALLVKRFCLLGGLAGSGKTQLAKSFGKWLGDNKDGNQRYLIVPVRADWTSPDPLFGFEDALGIPMNGRKAWNVPEPLRFIHEAAKEPGRLWLLVLDEMNIAHVERYFSDVLSGIESNEPIVPNVQLESDNNWRISEGSPEKIMLPKNLIIVGTVNIDETTYQFSPKVLDRAFTFEFRVQTDELSNSAVRPSPLPAATEKSLELISQIASNDEWHKEYLPGVEEIYKDVKNLHGILSKIGFEFGHRSMYEILRFSVLCKQSGLPDEQILDWSIMTKILPRIHGSAQQLRGLFDELLKFAESNALPLTTRKVTRMKETVLANGFVSFAE
jgi:hypothetical protein